MEITKTNINATSSLTSLPIPSNPTSLMAYAELLLVKDYDDQMRFMAQEIKQNTRIKKSVREHKMKLNELLNKSRDGNQIKLNSEEYKLLNSKPDFRWDQTLYDGVGGLRDFNQADPDPINAISNSKFEQVQFNQSEVIAANETAKWWGDPHFIDPDGDPNQKKHFDFQGKNGQTYNYLKDSNFILNATHKQWNQGKETVVGEAQMIIHGPDKKSEIIFNANQSPQINHEKMNKHEWYTLADQGRAMFDGKNLILNSAEGYQITLTNKGGYLDGKVRSGNKGVVSDGFAPSGVLGQLFDQDKEVNFKSNEESENLNQEFSIHRQNDEPEKQEYKVQIDQVKAVIERYQMSLDNLNSETELAQTELSTITSQRKLAFESISSILSKMFDGANSAVRNIR